jgi:beta-N-acetylhexosaminidase
LNISTEPPRKRNFSQSLVVAFIFGIAVGATLYHALLSFRADEPPPRAVSSIPDGRTSEGESEKITLPERPPEVPIWPARHLFVGVQGPELNDADRALLRRYRPGGVVLCAENVADEAQTIRLVYDIKQAVGFGQGLGDGPLIAMAQEGGENAELNLLDIPDLLDARSLAEDGQLEPIRRAALRSGEVALQRGIGVLMSPVLGVYMPGQSDAAWKVRTFGDQPEDVTQWSSAFVEAQVETGIMCVAKHYPGLAAAIPNADGLPSLADMELRELARLMFPFDEAIRKDVPGLLASHVAVPVLDREHPQRSAALSPVMIRKVLREQLAYDGVILCDDVSAGLPSGPVESALLALAAGCDAVFVFAPGEELLSAFCGAVVYASTSEDGVLAAQELERSKLRLDAWRSDLKLLEERYPSPSPEDMAPEPAPIPVPEAKDGEEPAAQEGEGEEPAAEGEAPLLEGESPDEEVETPSEGEGEEPSAEGETPVQEGEGEESPAEGETPVQEGEGEESPAEGETPVQEGEGEESPAEGENPAQEGEGEESSAEGETPVQEGEGEESPIEGEIPVQEAEGTSAEGEGATPVEPPDDVSLDEDESDVEAASSAEGEVSSNRGSTSSAASQKVEQPPNTKKVRHKITRGESLLSIARKYGVSTAELKAWNGITDPNLIKIGFHLQVYLPVATDE